MPQIHGHCDDRFAGVRDAFEENFTDRGELGAAVTVLVDGAPVVDLWGGWADAARTRPWERDTVVNVWSTGKGPTALCAHVLADRGLLDPGPLVRIMSGSRGPARASAVLSSITNFPKLSTSLEQGRPHRRCLNPPPCSCTHRTPLPDPT